MLESRMASITARWSCSADNFTYRHWQFKPSSKWYPDHCIYFMNKQRHIMPSNNPPAPFIDLTTTLTRRPGRAAACSCPSCSARKFPVARLLSEKLMLALVFAFSPHVLSPSHYPHTTRTIHRSAAIDSISRCIASVYISLARETIDKRANGASLNTSKALTLCPGAESASNDRTPTYTS